MCTGLAWWGREPAERMPAILSKAQGPGIIPGSTWARGVITALGKAKLLLVLQRPTL